MPWTYEPEKFKMPVPERGRLCSTCGSSAVTRESSYVPDFRLQHGVFLEAKGKLDPANRARLIAFRKAHPGIRLGLVFMANNWTTPAHTKRYTDWATANNIPSAVFGRPELRILLEGLVRE